MAKHSTGSARERARAAAKQDDAADRRTATNTRDGHRAATGANPEDSDLTNADEQGGVFPEADTLPDGRSKLQGPMPPARPGAQPPTPHPAVSSTPPLEMATSAARANAIAGNKPGPRVRVRALMIGYYDHARRRPGDVFTIDGTTDKDGNVLAFSDRWMERVSNREPERLTSSRDAMKERHDEILGGKLSDRATDSDPLSAGE